MTKREFIEKLKNYPDDAEILMFDFMHMNWITPNPIWCETNCWSNKTNFIGIE